MRLKFKSKPPKPTGEIVNKFKFSTGEIGRSGEIVKIFKFLTDNAMKLIENKSVVLSWVYLQPFCSTFFSYFTLLFVFGRRSRSRTIQKVEKRVLTSRRLWRGWGAVIIFDDFREFDEIVINFKYKTKKYKFNTNDFVNGFDKIGHLVETADFKPFCKRFCK